MIHIVFQEADVAALAASFELDEKLRGEIILIRDDYAVGPLENIYEESGIENRKNWQREVLAGGDYDGAVDAGIVEDAGAVAIIHEKLQSEDGEAWIWIAPNKHDVSGYYWLVNQMRDLVGKVKVLFLSNLPFINDKGHIFYPDNLFEIPAREFVKAQKLARTLTNADFELDGDEFQKLAKENKTVRILEGSKKLLQYDEDYFDKDLLKYVTHDWQKASRIIHHFLHKNKQTTGDAYLLWRLKKLIAEDLIDAQGELRAMKDFEVKSKDKTQTDSKSQEDNMETTG